MFSIQHLLRTASAILALTTYASALGTSCTAPLGAGTSGPNDPFGCKVSSTKGRLPSIRLGVGTPFFEA